MLCDNLPYIFIAAKTSLLPLLHPNHYIRENLPYDILSIRTRLEEKTDRKMVVKTGWTPRFASGPEAFDQTKLTLGQSAKAYQADK